MEFELRLADFVDDFIGGPDTRREAISALESVLARLRADMEAESIEENEEG